MMESPLTFLGLIVLFQTSRCTGKRRSLQDIGNAYSLLSLEKGKRVITEKKTLFLPPLRPPEEKIPLPFVLPRNVTALQILRSGEKPNCDTRVENYSNSCCGIVFFLGGGKAGSTTLAKLLKLSPESNFEEHDPRSHISRGPKEVCWARSKFSPSHLWRNIFRSCSNCTDKKFIALDACPQMHSLIHAQRVACAFPKSKFIMLLREPVQRMISHFNDNAIRFGSKGSIDEKMRSTMIKGTNRMEFILSDYVHLLQNFLRYFEPEQILIVLTESLSGSRTQLAIDHVHDFLRLPHRFVQKGTQANHHNNMSFYTEPNEDTARELYTQYFKEQNEKLFALLGRRLDWWDLFP